MSSEDRGAPLAQCPLPINKVGASADGARQRRQAQRPTDREPDSCRRFAIPSWSCSTIRRCCRLIGARLAFTTDSYVVTPIFFPGGDIGELAVNGTVNDLAMGGARPLYLSLAFILEEGLPIADLERVVESARRAAERAGVRIVTGDTKVVGKGSGDKIFINTSGIGAGAAGYRAFLMQVSPATRSCSPARSVIMVSRFCRSARGWNSKASC